MPPRFNAVVTNARSNLFGLCLLISVFAVAFVRADTMETGGVTYRSVSEIASKLGMKSEWNPTAGSQILKSEWTQIVFHKQSRYIEVNSIKIYLGYPVIEKKSRLYMPELDWQFTLSPLLLQQKTKPRPVRTIVIDPGHGGKDPGAQNRTLKLDEKDLTLKVARQLERLLEKKGYRVYLVRKDDRYITLEDRGRFARKKNADLFISIHFNSSENTGASGVETYAYTLVNHPSTNRSQADSSDRIFHRANRNDSRNVLFAYYLQQQLVSKTKEKDRGVKRARFTVIEELSCPGALVELGFISNTDTARKLRTDVYIDELASRIYSGIVGYDKRINAS